ncbi:MAG: outer membrane lipoprotein chaperone LolA [Gammaproteobacteria bacterium]|nr:outer membrane lipoprotein chaperone LolA [Gammaproteobacteria bacterium]MDP2141190.1 outer membrane lipoprotein chaperone LolA [Gammaproteobacteria bacterium]MDP2349136.1 outer membrane lipoprotein chaperone LolA [Gammaproteobacteria bacterium]
MLCRILKFLRVIPLVCVSSTAFAQDESVEKLTQLLGNIDTFQADVRQLIIESTGGLLEESEIRFMLKRPDGFYWETIAPFPELIVTDGTTLWNYQPDLLQVTLEPWDVSESELAAQLLNGRIDEIKADYTITGGAVRDNQDFEFILIPLDDASLYERVTIYFTGESLTSIHVDSGNGQRTFWEFFNNELNTPLADDVFVFIPPEDIDVIDNTDSANFQ